MNFTAQNASRKWANGAFRRIEAAMVTVVTVALLLGMPTGPAKAAMLVNQRLSPRQVAVAARESELFI